MVALTACPADVPRPGRRQSALQHYSGLGTGSSTKRRSPAERTPARSVARPRLTLPSCSYGPPSHCPLRHAHPRPVCTPTARYYSTSSKAGGRGTHNHPHLRGIYHATIPFGLPSPPSAVRCTHYHTRVRSASRIHLVTRKPGPDAFSGFGVDPKRSVRAVNFALPTAPAGV
jgi:hypothetical protein